MTSLLNAELLPDSAKFLLNFISLESLVLLISEYGGSRIILSKKTINKLNQLIDKEEVLKLKNGIGNETYTVPRCKSAMNAMRNAQILQDKRQNKMTIGQLAIKYGLTDVTIYRCLRRAEKQEYQARCKAA